MMVKDEAMLMSKSGGASPVMDGLYYWIDGRDYDIEGKTFTDKVSGDVVPASGFVDTSVINKRNNFLHLELPLRSLFGTPSITPSSPIYTLELVGMSNSGFPTQMLVATVIDWWSYCQIGVSDWSGWYGVGNMRAGLRIPCEYGVPYHVVSRHYADSKQVDVFVNGELIGTRTVEKPTIVWPLLMISYQSMDKPNFDYGCTRLYTRTLTDEEILQNYNYEKSLGRVD